MGGLTGPAAEISIGNVVSGGTPGSVLFVGAGGVLAENNTNLFWDNAASFLKVAVGTDTIQLNGLGARLSYANAVSINGVDMGMLGGALDASFYFYNRDADIYFGAANATQAKIAGTAGATRYITLTGSNGGNPTIGTSAGNLNIAPALQLSTLGAFAAGDKYLIVDAAGNVHVSALGPGS